MGGNALSSTSHSPDGIAVAVADYHPYTPVHPDALMMPLEAADYQGLFALLDIFKGVYVFGGIEAKAHRELGMKWGGEQLGLFGYGEHGFWLGELTGAGASVGALPSVIEGKEMIYNLGTGEIENERLGLVEKSWTVKKFTWASADFGVGGWVNLEHPDQLGVYVFFGPAVDPGKVELSSFVGFGVEVRRGFPGTEAVLDETLKLH